MPFYNAHVNFLSEIQYLLFLFTVLLPKMAIIEALLTGMSKRTLVILEKGKTNPKNYEKIKKGIKNAALNYKVTSHPLGKIRFLW